MDSVRHFLKSSSSSGATGGGNGLISSMVPSPLLAPPGLVFGCRGRSDARPKTGNARHLLASSKASVHGGIACLPLDRPFGKITHVGRRNEDHATFVRQHRITRE